MAEHGDGYHGAKGITAMAPVAFSSDAEQAGIIIDTQGYEEVTFYIASGVITTGTITPILYDGDDSGLSDAAAVADANLIGTEADATFAVTDDATTKALGYKGPKRYVRLNLVTAGGTFAGLAGAIAVLGKPRHAPVSYS